MLQMLVDQCGEEMHLAREVVEQPSLRHACAGRDRIQRQMSRPFLMGQLIRGLENPSACAAGCGDAGLGARRHFLSPRRHENCAD